MDTPIGIESTNAPPDGGRQLKPVLKKVWRIAWRVFTVLFVGQLCYIILLRWVDPPITFTQMESWATGPGFIRTHVGWDEISPELKLAVIASEDQLFFYHDGFD